MVYKVGFLEKIFGEKLPKVVTEYYEAGFNYYEDGFKYYDAGYKKAEGTVIWKQSRSIYTKDGLWTYWYHNGKKEKEVTYKNEMIDGLWTSWYENGREEKKGTYKDGYRDGLWTVWFENGKKSSEATYKDDVLNGKDTKWYKNGRKKEEKTYKDGEVYHKGVEVPELKKTLPPTKPKKIKPRSKRENKLIIGGKNITAERLKCALGSCYLKLMQDLLVQSGGWIVTDGFINKDFIIKSEAFSDLELKTKSELRNTAKTLGLIELANDYKTLKIQKERIVQILDSYKTKSFKKVPDPKSYSYNFYFLTYLGRVGQLRRGNDFPLIGNTVSIKNAKSAIATLHPIEIFGYRFLLEAILEQIIMDGVDGMGRIDGF